MQRAGEITRFLSWHTIRDAFCAEGTNAATYSELCCTPEEEEENDNNGNSGSGGTGDDPYGDNSSPPDGYGEFDEVDWGDEDGEDNGEESDGGWSTGAGEYFPEIGGCINIPGCDSNAVVPVDGEVNCHGDDRPDFECTTDGMKPINYA